MKVFTANPGAVEPNEVVTPKYVWLNLFVKGPTASGMLVPGIFGMVFNTLPRVTGLPVPFGFAGGALGLAADALLVTSHKLDRSQQLHRCLTEEVTKIPRPHTTNANRSGHRWSPGAHPHPKTPRRRLRVLWVST